MFVPHIRSTPAGGPICHEPASRLMRVAVVGMGATGARTARQLVTGSAEVEECLCFDVDATRAAEVAASLGPLARACDVDDLPSHLSSLDVVVLACPKGHADLAWMIVAEGAHVVSIADDLHQVEALLALDGPARQAGVHVVVGAGFSPGLSCLLAVHAASLFDEVTEIHVARAGTGGPACARSHHAALAGESCDWRDGDWVRQPGGAGRQLVFFPSPVDGLDCYRGGMPDAVLLRPAFPNVERIAVAMAATRRDRLTSRLPMLRNPHAEGLDGAARVEVRGRRAPGVDGLRQHDTVVYGALDRPAVAAGAVAAVAALWATTGQLARAGAAGLGVMVPQPVPFLSELAQRGVTAAVFEGTLS